MTGLLDVGAVYLRDIRSDGFALFFASLLGDEAEGWEAICGILSGRILSVVLMMVALAHNGYTTGPALKQKLLHGLPVFSVDPGGMVCTPLKVWISLCVCVYTSTREPSRRWIMGVRVCVFEPCVWETERERAFICIVRG